MPFHKWCNKGDKPGITQEVTPSFQLATVCYCMVVVLILEGGVDKSCIVPGLVLSCCKNIVGWECWECFYVFDKHAFFICLFKYLWSDDNLAMFSFVRVPLEPTSKAQTGVLCVLMSVLKCAYLSDLYLCCLCMLCSMGHVSSEFF